MLFQQGFFQVDFQPAGRIYYFCHKLEPMIQRIQSVYLLLSGVSIANMFFFPIAWYYGELHTLTFYIHGVVDHVPVNEPLFQSSFSLIPLVFSLLLIVVPVIIIFSFRNLARQLKLTRLHMMLLLVFIALIFFYYADAIGFKVNTSPQYAFGVFLPLISLVFNYLAQRGIGRDIRVIRSADRIR